MNMHLLFMLAMLTLTSSARANDDRPWTLSGTFKLPIVGPLDQPRRLTGGVLPTFQFAWRPGNATALTFGAEAAYGLDVPRWSIILGGVFAQYSKQPWSIPLQFTASLALLGGRMPVINAWGLAMNYSGLYARGGIDAAWTPREDLKLGMGCDVYRVNTWAWSGFAPAPVVHVDGRF